MGLVSGQEEGGLCHKALDTQRAAAVQTNMWGAAPYLRDGPCEQVVAAVQVARKARLCQVSSSLGSAGDCIVQCSGCSPNEHVFGCWRACSPELQGEKAFGQRGPVLGQGATQGVGLQHSWTVGARAPVTTLSWQPQAAPRCTATSSVHPAQLLRTFSHSCCSVAGSAMRGGTLPLSARSLRCSTWSSGGRGAFGRGPARLLLFAGKSSCQGKPASAQALHPSGWQSQRVT